MIWWIKHIIICLMSGFFLFLGIEVLFLAFRQDDVPVSIIVFLASNFIILVSAAIFFGHIYRMIRHGKKEEAEEEK